MAHGLLGLLRTRYPRFIFGLPQAAGAIPVFVFHDVAAAGFARQLDYLRCNGYRTLALDEFLAQAARKGGPRGARQVLLTFDDARLSFYENALPALRASGAHATVFAPTLWMGTGRPGASARLAGFATPWLLERHDIYDWPMRHEGGDRLGRPAPGTPIYGASPLLAARTRYLESVALREACLALVARTGAADFFSRPDCYARLLRVHGSRAAALHGRYARDEEFRALVASEFQLSRAAFEEHLGFAPIAFAYPWALGSPLSLDVAWRTGIRCVFGAGSDLRRARAISRRGPLPVFGRIKCDWLELLPGRNRAHLLPLLARKVARLGDQQHLAH